MGSLRCQSARAYNTKAPDAVTFSGTDGSYTDTQTPTWSWIPSSTNGGIGTYVLKVDADPEFDLNSTTYLSTKVLSDNATHTLTVRQRDQVAGVLGAPKTFSYKIKVNPAGAPVVKSDANVPNNGLTNNPKFTWVSGDGGNGTYRVYINNILQTHPQPGGIQTAWSVPLASGDGTYAIRVSEQDQMGRWGSEGTFTIKLDRTGPTISNIKMKSPSFDLPENFITNKDKIRVTYLADENPMEYECLLSKDDAVNDCPLTGTDALGNSSTLTRHVWRRSYVAFFTPDGSGNGSSWQEATSNINLIESETSPTITEFWLGSGNYPQAKGLEGGTFTTSKSTSIYGGFNVASRPVNKAGRLINNTRFYGIDLLNDSKATYDGVVILGEVRMFGNNDVTMIDCTLESPPAPDYFGAAIQVNGKLYAKNLTVVNQAFEVSHMYYHPYIISVLEGSVATIEDGSIIGNHSTVAESIVMEVYGTLNLKGSLSIYGNSSGSTHTIYVYSHGNLVVDQSVSFACGDIRLFGGTSSCGK